MFTRIISIAIFVLVCCSAFCEDYAKVEKKNLDELTITSGNIFVNNFNVVYEEAVFGGVKVSFQCTAKNKNEEAKNYTIYLAAFDSDGKLIFSALAEPAGNTHNPGEVETLDSSTGMVKNDDKGKVIYYQIRMVNQ